MWERNLAKLLLVRHGETEMGRNRFLCGSTDEPLNAQGLRQIDRLGERLAATHVDAIYSSDLQRARATAQAISRNRHISVLACPEMKEMDFGQCEGLTFDQVENRYPDVARLWLARSPILAYPGGESLDRFEQRVGQVLSRLQKHKTTDTVVLVAHLGSLRILLCYLLGIPRQHWWQFQLDNASLNTVETQPRGIDPDSDGQAMLLSLNDTSHLT